MIVTKLKLLLLQKKYHFSYQEDYINQELPWISQENEIIEIPCQEL
jgi:hypothetical protein